MAFEYEIGEDVRDAFLSISRHRRYRWVIYSVDKENERFVVDHIEKNK